MNWIEEGGKKMGKDDQLAYAYSILDRAVSLHKPKYAVAYNYDDLAMEYGFPGPALHGVMYIKVKGCPIVQMMRGQKKKKFDRLAQKAGRGCQEPAAHRDGGRALSHVNTERKKEEARGRNPRGDSMTTREREILSAPAQIAIPPTLTPGEQTPAVMTPQQGYRQGIEGIWQKVDQLPQGQDPEGFLAHRHRCLAGVWIQAPATSGLRSQFASRDGTRTPLVAPGKESNR